MANQDHIEILRKGVNYWNDWRKQHPEIIPDLKGAKLSDSNIPWPTENIDKANFRGINFSKSLLDDCRLRGANLRESNLIEAKLRGADLRKANLRGADLTRTSLNFTNFTLSNLSNVNLTDALFWETILARVNLRNTHGLESCRHGGPSIIDHRTIKKSGDLPLGFLRGIGLPDSLIDFYSSLKKTNQYYSCFISYSSKDQGFAEKLYFDLQNKGVRCWFAPEDMEIGADIWDSIDEAITVRDKLLLILSKFSLRSFWVEDEVKKAFAEEREKGDFVLFPIMIDDIVLDSKRPWVLKIRNNRNIGNFTNWNDSDSYNKSFEKLIKDLAIN
jgi:uncharacterized protein YjbI with pentapeptide repeats